MTPRDLGERFLAKAAQDEALIDRVITAQDIADETIGFHLQQAAEKLLKAVLAANTIAFRRTHDLVDLSDTLKDAGLPVPIALAQLDALNPFAVEARYDFLPSSSAPLDRAGMRQLVRALRTWAEALVHSIP
jgi:HEPN domain-containing protein